MNVKFHIAIALSVVALPVGIGAQPSSTLHTSHDATVHIVSQQGNSAGTGFMVGDQLVLTCFHVIAVTSRDATGMVTGRVFSDIQVTMSSGEVIPGMVVSLPTAVDSAPLQYDFAYLKLARKPSKAFHKLSLATDKDLGSMDLGDDVAFSGFPLAVPGMVTHRGMISGMMEDKSVIFIQGSVNKGNSGGALVNNDGRVLGIVSLREGGITQGLAELRRQITANSQAGTVTIMGVDPLSSTKMLIDTIDQYISVGIGYALNVKFSKAYWEKHPELNK